MNRKYLLAISVSAILLFLAVQVYEILNIWKQKEEQLNLRYETLSREAFSSLVSRTGTNGFEKSMTILDVFSGLMIAEELPSCKTKEDSIEIKKQIFLKASEIIRKSEILTNKIKSYISEGGNDTSFVTRVVIRKYYIMYSGSQQAIKTDTTSEKSSSTILINTFREERNTFTIQFDFYLDLKHKNQIILSETILSLSLIILSILIVLVILRITWKNLMEERRLSNLKTDFINNMTHELKTPLSTITVAGRTLEKDQIRTDEKKVVETAQLIGKQSIHLNHLINTILEVSLLERTEFEMEKKDVCVDEILHDIVSSFLTSCNYCASIQENFNCGTTIAKIDCAYFTTMINNLLTNAVKYCTTDPIIEISSLREEKQILINMTDNGAGISKEHIDHIFEKFYRVPQGNIHKTKGLGLGLYYVRRIVQAHGGTVSVTSKPGKGSTFSLTIPIK